jgi:hypothetical protein
MTTDTKKRSIADRVADADMRGSNWLARANALTAEGKYKRAARCHEKGQFWLDRSNKLRGLA